MKTYTRNFVVFTVLLALCAGGLGYGFYKGKVEIERGTGWVTHSYTVIANTYELSTLLEAMLAANRGYMGTGESTFLDEYFAHKEKVSETLAQLSKLVKDNPSQLSRIEDARLKFTDFTDRLEARAAALDKQVVSRRKMPDIDNVNRVKEDLRSLNSAIVTEEYGLLNARVALLDEKREEYINSMLLGGVMTILLLALINAWTLRVQERQGRLTQDLDVMKERLALALKGSRDGIFDWDMITNNFYWSPEYKQMLGYEPEEMESSLVNFNRLIHPDDHEAMWEKFRQYVEGNMSEFMHVFRMKHKSGRWVWVHCRGKALFDDARKPLRFVGAHSDVTAMKEAELQLKKERERAEVASQAKTTFLAHMSHEIRTPLTAISGIAEIFDRNTANLDDKQKKLVSTLNSSTRVLRELITDILDFSKIENGDLELDERQYPVDKLFEEVISMMSLKANEKGISFVCDYSSYKGKRLFGDQPRLRQILINLVGNAIKFTDQGGVTVQAIEEDRDGHKWMRVDVSDTGIGIAPENLDLVFEQFKQADSSVSRKYGGTGLGLPISRNLSRLMQGDIIVSSAPGKGSTFSLLIPTKVAHSGEVVDHVADANVMRKTNDRIKAALTGKNKVLMVEDYEGNIVVLSYILDEIGCEYDVARNGRIGVEQWETNHYDIILMDVQMPEMDGFAATKRIRELEAERSLPRTPIIGMTAHALVGDKDKCISAGMDAYLPKPIVENDLKTTILSFLKDRDVAQVHTG